MTLDQLVAFVAVAEESHFRRAAEKLGVPQPTLSARINALEERLGFLLFERKKNGARLTVEGHRFRDHAQVAISAMHAAQGSGRMPRGVLKVLSLGLSVYHAGVMGRYIIDNLPQEFGLRIEADYSERLLAQTAAGLLDASVILVPRISSDLEVELIGTDELVLVATPDCASDAEKMRNSYIQVQWGHNFFDFQARALGTTEIPRLCINLPSLAMQLILKNGGAAWLPMRQVAPHLEDGSLTVLRDYESFHHPIYLAHRKGSNQDDISKLKDLLVSHINL